MRCSDHEIHVHGWLSMLGTRRLMYLRAESLLYDDGWMSTVAKLILRYATLRYDTTRALLSLSFLFPFPFSSYLSISFPSLLFGLHL